jgi:hypothetical protein
MKPYFLLILIALLPALVRLDFHTTTEAKDSPPSSPATYKPENPRGTAALSNKPAHPPKTTKRTSLRGENSSHPASVVELTLFNP